MALAAVVQMCSSACVSDNLEKVKQYLCRAESMGAQLVVLPENFALMSDDSQVQVAASEALGAGPLQDFLREQAALHGLWIVGGTVPIRASKDRCYAASLVIDSQGEVAAQYNKIHLFDVSLSCGEAHQESDFIEAGSHVCTVDTPIGRLGLAVCYDLRFPELFRCMVDNGAQIFSLPSAFTVPTGQAHWHTLARARAIENFSYLLAAGQVGRHEGGRQTYGHSLIVDPWGGVITECEKGEGVVCAKIDLNYLDSVRQSIPAIAQRKLAISPA